MHNLQPDCFFLSLPAFSEGCESYSAAGKRLLHRSMVSIPMQTDGLFGFVYWSCSDDQLLDITW